MNKNIMLHFTILRCLSLALGVFLSLSVHAFCGFYVGKADAKLFNNASKVILAHHEDKTVFSMQNDYQGDLKEFALVVPVPQVLKKEQIHIGDPKVFERIDAYSAPRLVEYFDPDPCAPVCTKRRWPPHPQRAWTRRKNPTPL